ncbi:uncharacterized protein LOC112049611 [Bicyclus anynana]|uniref:Uncharacterized protein LOC112049611 n=1 Tax=Bicyclus anynana TaxID=110368 RepID=A0A6J1NE92_BICAN|nr:uncharacterized protein LOC112049611 [Bicyclus anynana]
MTTMAGPRKTISIHDYPEHLNPFREEDNHNKIRFWTIGRKLSRSNSITFSGIKDLRNSWSLRSFMRKGKKGEQTSSQSSKPTNHVNGDASPIVYRRALQYSSGGAGVRSTVGSPERADRYVYGGSVTPLPRSRFQERLRSSHDVNSPSATPRMARSDITGSRLSIESTNPFEEAPIPPVRASRRKKKRAPAPPSTSNADDSVTENLELRITESENTTNPSTAVDDDVEELNLKVELKIIEDEEKPKVDQNMNNDTELSVEIVDDNIKTPDAESEVTKETIVIESNDKEEVKETNTVAEIEDSTQISFSKVDITKYRRNSSVNEDEIKLRRGNLEDFHSLAPNKRSKSLSHTLDGSYVAYQINLNEGKNVDINSNEEPQRVVCKVYEDDSRKKSVDNSISSTEKEFLEIDKATRELEREISKLNTALIEDDLTFESTRLSVSEIRQKFDRADNNSPNPIPKPRRSHHGESNSPANGNVPA